MRWTALLFVCACTAAPAPRYPLHPSVRSASGGPIALLGQIARPGVVPYATGITLTCALRLAGGPTMLAGRFAVLHRGQRSFRIPVFDVIDGTAPDLELAPGDTIMIDAVED